MNRLVNEISLPLLLFVIAPLYGHREMVSAEIQNHASVTVVDTTPVAKEVYVIDKNESAITWKGSMVLGDNGSHIGYVYLSTGDLVVEKGQLTGGAVEIDMTSIEYKDKEHTNSPVQHLKSADFFDVYNFPSARFAITAVTPVRGQEVRVTGNLSIKGVTNAITFPAKFVMKDGLVNASGKVTIDRTQWGIRYKSGRFYDNLADGAVSDYIELEMKVVARKKA